ncbi:MAG TPA: hypothetical protein VHJ00_14390 [Bradyrhizobium sp.]|nr:hypothetical protein [Bradyrhizobium sp.]
MSYDFMMMKPRPEVTVEIESMEDLGERTLLRQDPAALKAALSSLFPELAWRQEDSGGWFGALQGEDSWYEFRIEAAPDYAWSICTSHRAGTRNLVPIICDTLGVLAFDGQANLLIWPAARDG